MTAAATRAGVFYALTVFLIGFALGTARVLLIVPRLGETAPVLLEAPLVLAASWFVCGCVNRLDVPRRMGVRSIMGVVALVVLMAAEFALGGLVFGRPVAEQFMTYGSAPGAIGLGAQIVFATFPIVQVWTR